MQSMHSMTKKDIIELIEKKYKGYPDNAVIATFFRCNEGYKGKENQCLMFHSTVEECEL